MEATAISETTKNGQIHKWPQQRPENGADVKQMLDECLLLERIFLEIWQIFMVSISLGGCLSLATASTTRVQRG